MQLITCLPPKSVPRTNHTDVNSVYVIVSTIVSYICIKRNFNVTSDFYKVDDSLSKEGSGIFSRSIR